MPWQKLHKANANNFDTIALIVQTANDYAHLPLVQQMVQQIRTRSATQFEFLRNLFHYVGQNVQYVEDVPGIEKVYTGDRTLREGKGDCKKMGVLIASALRTVGIPYYYKAIAYEKGKLEHIYIVVPSDDGKYITMDPVFQMGNQPQFNQEFDHVGYVLYDQNGKLMDLYQLGSPQRRTTARIGQGTANLHNSMRFRPTTAQGDAMGVLIKYDADKWFRKIEKKELAVWTAGLFVEEYLGPALYVQLPSTIRSKIMRIKAVIIENTKKKVGYNKALGTLTDLVPVLGVQQGVENIATGTAKFFGKNSMQEVMKDIGNWIERQRRQGRWAIAGHRGIGQAGEGTPNNMGQNGGTEIDWEAVGQALKAIWQFLKDLFGESIITQFKNLGQDSWLTTDDWMAVYALKSPETITVPGTESGKSVGILYAAEATQYPGVIKFRTKGHIPEINPNDIVTVMNSPNKWYNAQYKVRSAVEGTTTGVTYPDYTSVYVEGQLDPSTAFMNVANIMQDNSVNGATVYDKVISIPATQLPPAGGGSTFPPNTLPEPGGQPPPTTPQPKGAGILPIAAGVALLLALGGS